MSQNKSKGSRNFSTRTHKTRADYEAFRETLKTMTLIRYHESADATEHNMLALDSHLLIDSIKDLELCIEAFETNIIPDALRTGFILDFLKREEGVPVGESYTGAKSFITKHLGDSSSAGRVQKGRIVTDATPLAWKRILGNVLLYDMNQLRAAVKHTYVILKTIQLSSQHFFGWINYPDTVRGLNESTLALYATCPEQFDLLTAIADHILRAQLAQVARKHNRGIPRQPSSVIQAIVCPISNVSNAQVALETVALAKEFYPTLRLLHTAMRTVREKIEEKAQYSAEQSLKFIDFKHWLNVQLREANIELDIPTVGHPVFGYALQVMSEKLGKSVRGTTTLPCTLPDVVPRAAEPRKTRPLKPRKISDTEPATVLWEDLTDIEVLLEREIVNVRKKKRELEPYYVAEQAAKRQKALEAEAEDAVQASDESHHSDSSSSSNDSDEPLAE